MKKKSDTRPDFGGGGGEKNEKKEKEIQTERKFQKLNEMLCLNREYSGDLKVNCQSTIFDVHKLVLSCQSDVFCTMLDVGKWKKLETKNGEVKIDDVKPEVMETLIYFIYHYTIQDEMKINSDSFTI